MTRRTWRSTLRASSAAWQRCSQSPQRCALATAARLGRRRDRYERLARLAPGAQLSFFTAVHGERPAIKTTVQRLVYELASPGHPLFNHSYANG
jgi:hypothetical protein